MRLRYWLTRPQRIPEAGWYTLCVQLLLIFWLASSVAGAILLGVIDGPARQNTVLDLTILSGLIHGPMALVGWLTTRRKRWAVPTGLFLSTLNLVLPPIFMLLPVRMFFADLHSIVDASEYFAFVICALMLLAELGQVILYAAAMAAQKRLTQLATP